MAKTKEKSEVFLGTYFNRDDVLRVARLAEIFAWAALAIYVVSALIYFTQFMIQFSTGAYYQKGISVVDLVSYFMPYFVQVVPGLVYFIGLKFAQHGLLLLLDVEDNTRRAARK